jgi:hypothetical protein
VGTLAIHGARAIVEEDNVTQVMDLDSLRRVLGEDTVA